MFEYIQFYTKNLSNFTILLLIGVVIAIIDITIRNVVTGVYRNVRENMQLRNGGVMEGMDNKKTRGGSKRRQDSDGNAGSGGNDESCPKDCNAVEAMKSKLTGLIENAAKLQNDIQKNNEIIKQQHKSIETMQHNIQKLAQKRK
jgi:hypothetical protein